MKPSNLALSTLLIVSSPSTSAFTPPTFDASPNTLRSSLGFFAPSTSHIYPTISSSPFSTETSLSAYLGQDFNSSPSFSHGNDGNSNEETSYVQKMSPEERRENLIVMKQIFKHDLADLQRRRDYSGWVEAKKDLKKRQAADPWFALNDMLKEAVQVDEMEEAARIQKLLQQVGGPPPGVKPSREYALLNDIYGSEMSLSRAESIAKMEQSKKNAQVWRRMMAERKANLEAEEEEYWSDPLREEKEAKKRRERTMGKIYGELEEKRKKMEAQAKEIKEKYKDQMEQYKMQSPLEKALEETKKVLEEKKIQELESSTSASSQEVSYSENGRPRLPGDRDMTMGEIEEEVFQTSDVVTDNVRIEVESSYSGKQSDPAMRKHCFKYSIKITNLSKVDDIQLTSRKFEIQTVGMSRKDIVQGDGVTGRQPILKPGEVFQYSSTAPLSVRPIGTTVVAARMRGSYMYKILTGNGEPEEREAELGKFHFIFPESQWVQPVDYDDNEPEE